MMYIQLLAKVTNKSIKRLLQQIMHTNPTIKFCCIHKQCNATWGVTLFTDLSLFYRSFSHNSFPFSRFSLSLSLAVSSFHKSSSYEAERELLWSGSCRGPPPRKAVEALGAPDRRTKNWAWRSRGSLKLSHAFPNM
jgi:hypothetical protein